MKHHSSSYKLTWNKLAETRESALMHVAGYTDEKQLAEATEITVKWLEQTVGIHASDTVLEIGCGVGRVGQALAPRVAKWIGADVAESMLGHAAERLAEQRNVAFVPVNGFDLSPIPDASVDMVYCTVVFMHLQEWDRFNYIKEALRVLKPGGRLFVDNVNLDSDAGWEVFQASASYPPADRPVHISRCSTEPELRVFLKRAGFKHVRTHLGGVWVVACGEKPGHPHHA